MSYMDDSPYNIPSPEPIYSGSYVVLSFDVKNPWSNQPVDLTNAADITFSMTCYGNYNNDIVLSFSKNEKVSGFTRMTIEDDEKNVLIVRLFPDDTKHFENLWYDFQITLHSVDGLQNSVIGQGRIKIYNKI